MHVRLSKNPLLFKLKIYPVSPPKKQSHLDMVAKGKKGISQL